MLDHPRPRVRKIKIQAALPGHDHSASMAHTAHSFPAPLHRTEHTQISVSCQPRGVSPRLDRWKQITQPTPGLGKATDAEEDHA